MLTKDPTKRKLSVAALTIDEYTKIVVQIWDENEPEWKFFHIFCKLTWRGSEGSYSKSRLFY